MSVGCFYDDLLLLYRGQINYLIFLESQLGSMLLLVCYTMISLCLSLYTLGSSKSHYSCYTLLAQLCLVTLPHTSEYTMCPALPSCLLAHNPTLSSTLFLFVVPFFPSLSSADVDSVPVFSWFYLMRILGGESKSQRLLKNMQP